MFTDRYQKLLCNARLSGVVFSSLAVISLVLANFPPSSPHIAFAMGDNPTSCNNRYDATITSVIIQNSRGAVDVVQHPSAVIRQKVSTGYDVTIKLHTNPSSSLGNTDPGSVWYSTSAYGYSLGTCVSGAAANHDIVITLHDVYMGQANPSGITRQTVTVGSWPDTQQVNYLVVWHP